MSRTDLQKHPFPTEYEEETLQLLETFGEFKDPGQYAELIGVSKIALRNFLQTDRAKEAVARALPNAKELLRPHIQLPSTAQDPALLDADDHYGVSIIEPEFSEGIFQAAKLLKDK